MSDETLSPPAAPKGATVKAPPEKKPPLPKPPLPKLPPKQKRGGVKRWLFLFFLLAIAVLYGVFRYPQQVHRLTGWQPPPLPALLRPLIGKNGTRIAVSADKQAEKTAPTAPTAQTEQINALQTQVQELSKQLAATQATADNAAARAGRGEQQLGRIAAQIAGLNEQRDNTDNSVNLQVRLIDLQLQFNGDSQKAAADLRRVAVVAGGTEAGKLLDEAARLESVVERQRLVQALRAMQTSPEETETETIAAEQGDTTVGGYLKSIFNVRRVNRREAPSSQDIFKQLEWLLLLGRYDEYWRLLQDSPASQQHDDAVKANLNKLIELGMPAYYVQLL